MKLLIDCSGRAVRLTDERLAHILGHQELIEMDEAIERAVLQPMFVRSSRADHAVRLFYDFCTETPVGSNGYAS